jgi:ABC-type polysaccharide/polyol phosphate export permease
VSIKKYLLLIEIAEIIENFSYMQTLIMTSVRNQFPMNNLGKNWLSENAVSICKTLY